MICDICCVKKLYKLNWRLFLTMEKPYFRQQEKVVKYKSEIRQYYFQRLFMTAKNKKFLLSVVKIRQNRQK
jgi:hypothetical protein